jgi:mono/diheme cytochrome c family protein
MRIATKLALVALAATLGAQAASYARRDVFRNNNATFEKECGSCHFPYQAGWLPERSWRAIMSSLANHFGENAELKPAQRQEVLNYLVANSADKANSLRSHEMMEVIKPGETPTSITKVLYVGGIHGGFLDPNFKGKPQVKTLANCATCHDKADRGWFSPVTYEVSDETFRTDDVDMSASMPAPAWMRIGGKK